MLAKLRPRGLADAERQIIGMLIAPPEMARGFQSAWLERPEISHGGRDLLPQLSVRSAGLGLTWPADLVTRLNTASLLETQRARKIDEIRAEIESGFARASLAPVLIEGPSSASDPQSRVRHISRLCWILPDQRQTKAAAAVLRAAGCTALGGPAFRHASKLALALHDRALPAPFDAVTYHALAPNGPAEHCVLAAIAGVRAAGGADLRWLVDAGRWLQSGQVEAERLAFWLGSPVLRCVVAATLDLLAEGFGCPVPAIVPPATRPNQRALVRAVAALWGRRALLAAAPDRWRGLVWLAYLRF